MNLRANRSWSIRCWDMSQRALAAALLLLGGPLLLVIAALVWFTSPGPVLFRQMRPGLHRRPFHIVKFRTMTVGSDQIESLQLQVTHHEPRVTPVGRILRRLKLDELPQLWNVVRGEMSFVGPRPIGPALDRRLSATINGFNVRYAAKPGLTGLGQICIDDNHADIEQDWRVRLESEHHYIKHQSIAYDLLVILLTGLFLIRRSCDPLRTARDAPQPMSDRRPTVGFSG